MLDTCRRCALVNTLLGLVALVPGLLTKALGRRDGSRGGRVAGHYKAAGCGTRIVFTSRGLREMMFELRDSRLKIYRHSEKEPKIECLLGLLVGFTSQKVQDQF